MLPSPNIIESLRHLHKAPKEDHPVIHCHEDRKPTSSWPDAVVTQWGCVGVGACATFTHGALQPTVKSTLSSPPHSEASCSAGLVVTDTRRKASGHRVRPHLTHWHGDGRRAAAIPTHTHTHTNIPESSAAQMIAQHDGPEHKLLTKRSPQLQQQVWNDLVPLRGEKRVSSHNQTRVKQGYVTSGGMQSDSL